MVLDKFNMVDMEGVDIIENQGVEIPGLYQKLAESIAQCRYQCLYNWKSGGVNIPPSFVELVVDPDNGNILISTGIYVTPEDVITTASLDAGVVLYDPSVTYQSGTVGAALNNKADKTQYVTLAGTTVTQTGEDNTMYLCGELAELTFSTPAQGQTAIRFRSGATPTVASFPNVTEWMSEFDPDNIEASKLYEINVLYGVGVAQWT